MKRQKCDMVVDIRCLKAGGEILDMGFKGGGIIYRALKNMMSSDETAADDCVGVEEGYGWVQGYPPSLPFECGRFDTVIAFFSISMLDGKSERARTIAEIARILKENGRLILWDYNIKHINMGFKKRMKVILPGDEEAVIDIKTPVLQRKYGMDTLLPSVEKCFNVINSYVADNYFFIEAVKKYNQRNDAFEDTFDSH